MENIIRSLSLATAAVQIQPDLGVENQPQLIVAVLGKCRFYPMEYSAHPFAISITTEVIFFCRWEPVRPDLGSNP
jgi:hypothetical protein